MPTPKKPAQAIDAVKTTDVEPPLTSRPVIVTNRPMMASDPMLNTATPVEDEERPSNEPSKTAPLASGEKVITREARTIAPMNDQPSTAAEQNAPEQATSATMDASQTKTVADPSEADREETSIPGEATPPKELEHSDTPGSEATKELFTVPSTKSSDAPEEASDRELELEQLIAKGTYVVPIGQVKRRRRKLLLIVFFLVVLAVMAFDLLLDTGIVTLEGIPHTNLF